MLLTFNILPLLLCALYPFHTFQKLLSCCCSQQCKVALQIFMDSFHGYYKHTSCHYQHFATLYIALRFLNLLVCSIFTHVQYLLSTSLLMVFTSVLVTKFRPYKEDRNNTIDIIMFLALIVICTSAAMHSDPILPRWVKIAVLCMSAITPPTIISFVLLKPIPHKTAVYLVAFKSFLMKRLHEYRAKRISTSEEQTNFVQLNVNYSNHT